MSRHETRESPEEAQRKPSLTADGGRLWQGFKEDVETILDQATAEGRQTVLFSATHPPWVRSVSRQYQTEPIEVDAVGAGQSEAATTVEHRAILTPSAESARCSTLADVIAVYGTHESRTIVFTSTKREVDELSVSGPLAALSPQPLHGDVSQSQRELTLKRFRDGHFPVLIATDVAARGIDISGVDLIVQYRMPQDPDSYVHRSGRTGRAGRSGVSLVLYSEREVPPNLMRAPGQPSRAPGLMRACIVP